MIHKGLMITGIFFLLCAAFPLIGMGIINTGVAVMTIIGFLLILLPKYWYKIAAISWLRNFFVFAVTAGLCYSVTVSALMLFKAYLNEPPEQGKITVIVLGGGIKGDQPMLMLRRRLNAAYRYMRKNPEAVCIVTGGQGPDEDYPEAVVMKKYLMSIGIPGERVILEDKSKNTRENLKFAAALIPEKGMPTAIATDGFHQLRASIFAKTEGLQPYAISSSTPWGLLPSYWVRDMLGVAWAWLTT